MMEFLSIDLLTTLGPTAGVFLLSIYFIKSFMSYSKSTNEKFINELQEIRIENSRTMNTFTQAVTAIDTRLQLIEAKIRK